MDANQQKQINEILFRVSTLERQVKIMIQNQAALDATIAALPQAITAAVVPAVTSSVETQLAPVITALEAASASSGVDFTNEINSLNAIPASVAGTVAPAVATSVAANFTPPTSPATPPAS
jgi:hypothetical protein